MVRLESPLSRCRKKGLISWRKRFRLENQNVNSRAWEEGGRLSGCPGFVAVAVMGRKRVAALAAGHVEIALGFAARRDGHPLRGAKGWSLDPGHILPIARQGLGSHVQAEQFYY